MGILSVTILKGIENLRGHGEPDNIIAYLHPEAVRTVTVNRLEGHIEDTFPDIRSTV